MNPAFTDDQTLLPTIAVDAASGKVLMLAYMNREAWQQTLDSGVAVYYSRSRQRLWKKGEQSGHVQLVREIRLDCDGDTILLEVDQQGGAACHEGYASCFFRRREGDRWIIDGERIFDPAEVYSKPKGPHIPQQPHIPQ